MKAKLKPNFRGRYAPEIEILDLNYATVEGPAVKGGYKNLKLVLVESHVVRDRIRLDPATRAPVAISIDRTRQFLIREDQLRTRYSLV